MRIAVAGGTGTLGGAAARLLAERGHEVVVLSRTPPRSPAAGIEHRPVDLAADDGVLATALQGCEVVVDALNGAPTKRGTAFLVGASRRMLGAAREAGAGHHVLASIVGVDRVPTRYYRAKVAQELDVHAAGIPWTIVRATQFHTLVAGTFATAARFRVLPAPRGALQPIDHREAARVVADVAEGDARHERVDVAGPEVLAFADLARRWKAATGTRALVAPVPLKPDVSRALRAGALTNPQAAVAGSPTFADWLARRG